MFSDQFLPAIAKVRTGLPVCIDDDRLIVEQKEGVRCVIHEGAEAHLAGAEILLGLPQFGDVLHHPKLTKRAPRLVPADVALAVHHA